MFSSHTISFCPKKDLKNDTTVMVEIPLFGRLASYVRMELVHADEWLLLSEIQFRSGIVQVKLDSIPFSYLSA